MAPIDTQITEGRPDTLARPLVSVVMPSYNTAQYIREAVDSVLEQDYPNLELLVIDDGSTDATPEIIEAYGERVRFFTQQNAGAGAARNLGLREARGEYIAFLDSDDVWLPGKLQAQVEHFETNPDVGVVYSRWQTWKPGDCGAFHRPEPLRCAIRPGIVREGSGWLYNGLLFTSMLHTITVMMRRRTIEQIGFFDTRLKRGQDYDYWLRASRISPIHQLDAVYALYRLHGEGCIKKWPNENYERIVVEKALNTWGLEGPDGTRTDPAAMRGRLTQTSFSFGYHHYWGGDPHLAKAAFRECVQAKPISIRYWTYLILSSVKTILTPRKATV